MNIFTDLKNIVSHPFFKSSKTHIFLWVLILPVLAMTKNPNNFLIFRGVFWHTIHKLPLDVTYPAEYDDLNHYGVFFSTIIAPFALPPVWLGMLLWLV